MKYGVEIPGRLYSDQDLGLRFFLPSVPRTLISRKRTTVEGVPSGDFKVVSDSPMREVYPHLSDEGDPDPSVEGRLFLNHQVTKVEVGPEGSVV